MKTTYILGVPIHIITLKEATEKLLSFVHGENNHIVVTPNPEMVVHATKDEEFLQIIKGADLIIPDGIGLVLASKFVGDKISQRVPGVDLVTSLFAAKKHLRVYILGGAPGVGELAKKNIEDKYSHIKVVGTKNGYFKPQEEEIIVEEIKRLKPHVLLVGLGFPKQEKWISKHKDLPVNVSMGVGGTIDVFAGVVKRAPKIFIKFNLEWFYRLLTNPKRILRMAALPIFVVRVLRQAGKNLPKG